MLARHSLAAVGCFWFVFALSGAVGLAVEQRSDTLEGLRLGIRLVQEGDFAAAIDVLEAAAMEMEAEQAEPRDMARSYFYAGVARVFIVGEDEARFAFLEARRHDPEFRPVESEFPRRVIRLWNEASSMAPAPEPASASEFSTLTVTTQPTGATVYVAGRPRGETPVEIAGLRPGDHRVTLVRSGYVNNSRIVALRGSRNEFLEVALTRASGGSGAGESGAGELQQDATGGGGGWWKWAALAGGGGAAAYFALTRNQPPVAGLNVTPRGSGMAGLTQYRFDGGASSDPDNDVLTYSWNFGDGGSGSGRNATHVYDSPGTYSVTLTVSDGKEQATATSSVTVTQNLDGGTFSATGTLPNGIGLRITLDLDQNGTRLSGRLTIRLSARGESATLTGDLSGNLSSSNNFVCPCDIRLSVGSDFQLDGTVNSGATVIEGRLSGILTGTIRLPRQ